MITIIAALPQSSEQVHTLRRELSQYQHAQIILLNDARASSVNTALQAAVFDRVLIIDEYSIPRGNWAQVSFPKRFGILGGLNVTYAGTRAGYIFNRELSSNAALRRRPIAAQLNGAVPQFIDLPNEGVLLMRRSVCEQLRTLDERLPLSHALLDYALRVREAGFEIGFDASISLDRVAGVIEPTLDDEIEFSRLRSKREWAALIGGPARRTEFLTVYVIAHGSSDERRLQHWLKTAGYPIARTYVADGDAPAALLRDELIHRDRNIALIDLNATPCADWLLCLAEVSVGDESRGIITADTSLAGQRLVEADASATLVISHRIPARITIDSSLASFDETIAALSRAAATCGIVTMAASVEIERKNNWRARYLDAYSLEYVLPTISKMPTVSMILLAGSSTGVHRYTTDALRSCSGEVAQLFVVVRSDAPKITARLRNHPNVELMVDPDDELAGNALSRALGSATGDIIVVMRDDFLVAEHWLETAIAHLDRIPQAGIVVPRMSSAVGVQNCEDESFADSVEFRHAAERRRKGRAREAQLVDIVQMPSLVMRREVLETIGAFDETLATSHMGLIDYCIRARTVGFDIVLAEDVYSHHIPFEHSELPLDQCMNDAAYARAFSKKWQIDLAACGPKTFESLIGSALAHRHRFVMPQVQTDRSQHVVMRSDEERVVLLLPLTHEDAWQRAGQVVRKYLTTFTAEDRVTLAIGRQDSLKTSVVAQRIRKMIAEVAMDEALVPDIVISDSASRSSWLSSLPEGPRYLLTDDVDLPSITVWEDLSPSGLRRAVQQFLQSPA